MEGDPFDTLLDLEDNFYNEGYEAGVADGARAGRIEGRVFGLEKGFEKFAAMGMLHGKAAVWASRVQPKKAQGSEGGEDELKAEAKEKVGNLPPLPENSRLEKHIQTLYALAEPETFATENTEEAVADFDDRFKRAGAKAKVIERIVGDGDAPAPATEASSSKSSRRVQQQNVRKDDDMEAFADRRFVS